MSGVWVEIMKNYIRDFDDLERLNKRNIFEGDHYNELLFRLLFDIMETFRSEVEE